MSILHISYPKSGGYFMWKLLDAMLLEREPHRSYVQTHPVQAQKGKWADFSIDQFEIDQILIQDDNVWFQIETQIMEPIQDVKAYVDACSHVWTHSYLCERSRSVLPLFEKVFLIVRDPRDALVSMAHFASTPFIQRYHPEIAGSTEAYLAANTDSFLQGWVRHTEDYLAHADQLGLVMLTYEALCADLPGGIREMGNLIGLTLNDEQVQRIGEAVDINRMRKETPQHVRKGGSGGFRKVLNAEQQLHAAEVCGPTMRKLGYAVD